MARDVRVVVDQKALRALLADPELGTIMVERAAPRVREARLRAPRLTGAGANSISAERSVDDGEQTVHVAWDRESYYMLFHEQGTRLLPARPFLVPTFGG